LYQKHFDEKTAANEFAVSLMTQTSDGTMNPYHRQSRANVYTVPGGLGGLGFNPGEWGASPDDDIMPGQSSTWTMEEGSMLVPSPVGTGSLHSQYGLATTPSTHDSSAGGTDWGGVLKSFATSLGTGFGFGLAGGKKAAPVPAAFPVGKALVIGGAIAIPLIYLLTRRS
jgi:hypothetical protein